MEQDDTIRRFDGQAEEGLRFSRRMYLPRAIGLALGGLCISSVLWQDGAHPVAWAAIVAYALLWPHLAYFVAARSRDPRAAERRNLVLDSAFGGAWIALVKFDLLASVLIAVMLSMDKLSVGGVRLLARSAMAMALACGATAMATGFEVQLETTALTVAASIPLLIVYPMMVGFVTLRLARRVRAQNVRLAELGRTDGLSGLYNRTYWEEEVEREFQRNRRLSGTASVLMVDIDHFKAINDRYGHMAGDEVIRSVAKVLRECVRSIDIIGRYGGEEFGILLPETAAEGAGTIAERIRTRVEDSVFAKSKNLRCTISIGIATVGPGMQSRLQWIESADRALYRAKDAGRNRVEA